MIARTIQLFALVAALGFTALSVGVGYSFGASQSTVEIFGVPLWGAASALAAAALPTLPFLMTASYRARNWGALVAAVVLAVLFAGFTLVGSFGYGAASRSEVASTAQAAIDAHAEAVREVDRLEAVLAAIPANAGVEAATARLATLRAAKSTTRDEMLAAHDAVGNAKREVEARRDLKAARGAVPQKPKAATADPQAEGLAALSGGLWTADQVRSRIAAWLALLLDLGAALMFYVAAAPMGRAEPGGDGRRRVSGAEFLNATIAAAVQPVDAAPSAFHSAADTAAAPAFARCGTAAAPADVADGGSVCAAAAASVVDAAPSASVGSAPSASVGSAPSASNVVQFTGDDGRITAETVAAFIAAHCVTAGNVGVATGDFALAYGKAHGLDVVSAAQIGRSLAELGYERLDIRTDGERRPRRGWLGLALRAA